MEEVSKYQKFETTTINRGQIKNAEYNPVEFQIPLRRN